METKHTYSLAFYINSLDYTNVFLFFFFLRNHQWTFLLPILSKLFNNFFLKRLLFWQDILENKDNNLCVNTVICHVSLISSDRKVIVITVSVKSRAEDITQEQEMKTNMLLQMPIMPLEMIFNGYLKTMCLTE